MSVKLIAVLTGSLFLKVNVAAPGPYTVMNHVPSVSPGGTSVTPSTAAPLISLKASLSPSPAAWSRRTARFTSPAVGVTLTSQPSRFDGTVVR